MERIAGVVTSSFDMYLSNGQALPWSSWCVAQIVLWFKISDREVYVELN